MACSGRGAVTQRRRRRRRLRWAAVAPALIVLAACGQQASDGFLLPPRVDAGPLRSALIAAGVEAAGEPELAEIEVAGERRPAILTTTAGWRWRGRVPRGATLTVGAAAVPAAWRSMTGLTVTAAAGIGGKREILEVARTPASGEHHWLDVSVDLGRFAGRELTLELSAEAPGLSPEQVDANLIAWAPAALGRRGEGRRRPDPEPSRPNILLVVIDALRADHLTPYGYGRDTSPEIARRLAARGTVVEGASSQAPWTLPSVISFLTGRYPGELLRGVTAYGIPEGVPSLAERLAPLGYRTGAFVANPTLHAGNGIARGFETFYSAPAVIESMLLHADSVNVRAVPWLRSYQHEPFFLYVHYLDPHDPYDNPDLVDGRSSFDPDYRGTLTGGAVHGVYLGQVPLPDPPADVAFLTSLYDSEIRYVDRFVGELLATLDPAVLANTLVVLTADHGEELHDHGGWKHGETLYQELIHVPLIVRWDGHVRAGARLGGTVRLVDLAPTLLAAAGGGGPAGAPWAGVDLLGALAGEAPPPRLPAFAETTANGPLRAAALADGWKLVLFDRAAPFTPADPSQDYLSRRDMRRLAREELYDLGDDPGERRNRIADRPEEAARLAPIVYGRLERQLPGLRVVTAGLAPGAVLSGSIVFRAAPAGWASYFLGPEDRAVLVGRRLDLRLVGEAVPKGVRVLGEREGIEAIDVAVDGRPLAAGKIAVGAGRPYAGGALAAADLVASVPPITASPLLFVWLPAEGGIEPTAPEAEVQETERRLRALGYVQ